MTWEEARALAGFAVMLAIVLTPIYLLMRGLLKLARIRYGFAPEPPDDGKPLRVCDRCANTVLEADYSHCPYCGALLAPVPARGPAQGDGEPRMDAGAPARPSL